MNDKSKVIPITYREVHERRLRQKTGEYYDYHAQITSPDFDLRKWADSFGKRLIFAELKPIDFLRSIARCCVASGEFAEPKSKHESPAPPSPATATTAETPTASGDAG